MGNFTGFSVVYYNIGTAATYLGVYLHTDAIKTPISDICYNSLKKLTLTAGFH